MFEIGFWELALLAVLGLVVLGPEKLPKVASQLGRYAGQARRMARTPTTTPIAQVASAATMPPTTAGAPKSPASSARSAPTR
mgnify:CR=1 FL=1